jgi:LuxR family transcriptional regulator, maltose regulon positive regulatory protein
MEQRTQDPFLFPYRQPAAHANSIARPTLEACLDTCLYHPLMLVTGPAGAGKTTVVQNWVQQKPTVVCCWIALENMHNDMDYFWRELEQASHNLHHPYPASLSSTIKDQIHLDHQTDLLSSFTILAAERGQEIVLVLDNYQEIQAKTIQHAILSFVEHAAPHIHLVLISRVDPQLPLARLHIQGTLVEIEAEQLRFSRDEAALLCLQSLGRMIKSEIIDDLYERTEGWAAGLKLALLAMQTKTSQASMRAYIKSFNGSDRYVARYLEEEVFEHLADDTQRFLLFTSIVEKMHHSLCDAITEREDSFTMLESLQHNHIFAQSLANGWYRYERFFLEFLQARLHQRYPEIIDTLHHRAHDWYEQHTLHEDALKHRLAITRRDTLDAKKTPDYLPADMLSDRELMVLNLIARGLSNQEVAHTLIVSISTVKTHLNSIYEKLHVHTRLQAVNRGYELALLTTQTSIAPPSRTHRIETKQENG